MAQAPLDRPLDKQLVETCPTLMTMISTVARFVVDLQLVVMRMSVEVVDTNLVEHRSRRTLMTTAMQLAHLVERPLAL